MVPSCSRRGGVGRAVRKMQLLDRLLTSLRKSGHKTLIFSQMTRMLDLLESFFEQRGDRVCRIDGSVKQEQRRDAIDAFNKDPTVDIFLLSLALAV